MQLTENNTKPCPFCGAWWGKYIDTTTYAKFTQYQICCTACGAKVPKSEILKRALELWNKRETEATNERLR